MQCCRQGIRMAQFVISCRTRFGHSLKSVLSRPLRSGSTLVRRDTTVTHGGTVGEHSSPAPWNKVICASDAIAQKHVSENMFVYEDFITEDEEKSLVNEVEPYLKRLHYEHDHWDNAIVGYRETEKKEWNERNKAVLQRVRTLAFAPDVEQLAYVHVLDVMAAGVIKQHVDSTRYCGSTIAGLSLLSAAVMRLTHDKDKTHFADILLPRRSLYIMQGTARYQYAHEILPNEESQFNSEKVERSRRISVICRSEPLCEDDDR